MRSIIAICVLMVTLAAASTFTQQEYQSAFLNWQIAHQRQYVNQEFTHRFNVFKKNMDYVQEWNSKNSMTVLALNANADLTNEEYQRAFLGTKFDASKIAQSKISVHMNSVFHPEIEVAQSVDWRTQGAVTAIKNQGQCGGCWSFSTTGATEGAHQISTGNLVSLSEQNLIDCSSSYGNTGCDGGLMTSAFEYIIANKGIDTEDSYPYQAVNGAKCKYNPANSAATLSSYTNVVSGSESDLASKANIGPVSVAIDASHSSFQLYSSGVYFEPACSSSQLDHGVLVVGYGVSGSSSSSDASSSSGSWSESSDSNSTDSSNDSWSSDSSSGSWSDSSSGSWSDSSNDSWSSDSSSGSWSSDDQLDASVSFWIVKNSWGTGWGMDGYILMAKDRNNNCGISTMATLPSV
eukprot:gene8001-9396_t